MIVAENKDRVPAREHFMGQINGDPFGSALAHAQTGGADGNGEPFVYSHCRTRNFARRHVSRILPATLSQSGSPKSRKAHS